VSVDIREIVIDMCLVGMGITAGLVCGTLPDFCRGRKKICSGVIGHFHVYRTIILETCQWRCQPPLSYYSVIFTRCRQSTRTCDWHWDMCDHF